MPGKTAIATLIVVVLFATAQSAPVAGTASTTFNIDDDHALTGEKKIQSYEQSGVASISLDSPKMDVTVAEKASACGLDEGIVSDTRNDYLCLNYQQETAGTVNIEIPDAYWTPYVREQKESIADAAPARFDTIDNSSATAVTVNFDGPTKAVYAIPEDVSAAYSLLSRADNRSSDWLGVEILGDSKTTEWRYRNLSASDTLSFKIQSPAAPGETVVQYDAGGSGIDQTWLAVPEDPDDPSPLYRTTRDNADGSVFIVVQADELGTEKPPDVRFRAEGGARGQLKSAMRNIRNIRKQLQLLLKSLPIVGYLGTAVVLGGRSWA